MDVSTILSGTNLLLALGVFVLITVLRIPFKSIFESRLGQRFLPLLPLVLGVGGALVGACSEDCNTWQERVLIGLIAGFAASHFFKIGKTTVFGWGLPVPEPTGEPVKAEPAKEQPAEPAKVEPPKVEQPKAVEPPKVVEPPKALEAPKVEPVVDAVTKPVKAPKVVRAKRAKRLP